MLTVIKEGFSSLLLREKLAERLAKKAHALWIVPEQDTLRAEAEMAKKLPSDAPLYFEVTNFSRLADTVFRTVGGIAVRYADKTASALFLWKTLNALREDETLRLPKNGSRAGQIAALSEAIGEFVAAGISVGEIDAAAKRLSAHGELCARLSSLARVYTVCRAEMQSQYGDATEALDDLVTKLREFPVFRDQAIFISGFSSFTGQEYAVLAELCRMTDVTVSLALPPVKARQNCFEETADTAKRLAKLAADAGVKHLSLDGTDDPLPPPLFHARNELFRTDRACVPYTFPVGDTLRLYSALDPFDACEFIAADVKKRVSEEGARYRDFAIIAEDPETYRGILDAALDGQKIPAFFSRRNDICTYAAIKAILCAYAVAVRSFRREDVLTYVKCGFCDCDADEIDRFEIYTEFWKIHGKRFSETWDMHPDGYVKADKKAAGILADLNRVRDRIVAPLAAFAEKANRCRTVREHAEVLYGFTRAIDMENRLRDLAAKTGSPADADILSRLYKTVCGALDGIVDILGDEETDTEEFAEILQIAFRAADLGQIPSSADALTVGSAAMLRPAGIRYVYLLGANAGEFPGEVRQTGLFDERERALLSSVGLSISPDPTIRASKENFCFLRALCSAQSATVLCTKTDATGAVMQPSVPFTRLNDLLSDHTDPENIRRLAYHDTSEMPPEDRIFCKEGAVEKFAGIENAAAREALEALLPNVRLPQGELCEITCRLDPALASEMFRDDVINLTQSRIDKYEDCPFAYFCQYELGLDRKEKAEFNAASIGTMIHAVLEYFFKELALRGKTIKDVKEDELSPIVEKVSEDYVRNVCPKSLQSSPRLAHLLTRLKSASATVIRDLREEFAQSDFSPEFYELSIGKDNAPDPITCETASGKKVKMYGTIDRVDLWHAPDGNVYVRVIDYKTGAKDFSLDKVRKGRNLQMLLYLFAIRESRKPAFLQAIGCTGGAQILPAGVLYLEIDTGTVTLSAIPTADVTREAQQMQLARKGLLLQDEEMLRAMDKALGGHFIPIRQKKENGAISGKTLVTKDTMDSLEKEVCKVFADIGERITQGDAKIEPARKKESSSGQDPCENCAVRSVCRKV